MVQTSMNTRPSPSCSRHDEGNLLSRYLDVRQRTESLLGPLGAEDMVVQSMPDASPAKWHIAHTTWFFETFLLTDHLPGYRLFNPDFGYLFNSYYETLGPRQPRVQRGLLTRPTVKEVLAYRAHVDQHMKRLLDADIPDSMREFVLLGIAHEEQHQELLLMDILHLFNQSPLKPVYDAHWPKQPSGRRGQFKRISGGLVEIGAQPHGLVFDNEGPRHKTWLEAFEISDRLVTNGEWLDFMRDDGYRRADLWLSDGWDRVRAESWHAPLYWLQSDDGWSEMTLGGLRALDPAAPVTHVSYFEAAAFAQWVGARLPTEAEWECAANAQALEQRDDVAWQWTQSAYSAYPGFRPTRDAIGEYNGKFMIGQMVLRGGCEFTPVRHTRSTYRNFFRPEQRWMLSGLRLARDLQTVSQVSIDADFAADVVAGLAAPSKNLSPKYFYDALGSELFDAICQTPEYYPTKTETALLRGIAAEIARDIPAGAVLVELGSGGSQKTRIVLDAAPQIAVYVPVDVSGDALDKASQGLVRDYPDLLVAPQVQDFSTGIELPAVAKGRPRVGFFPGSTIGNFTPPQAVQLMRTTRQLLGENATFVVGVDLVKDLPTLLAAYNDAQGITEQFNKNLLTRINRELDGDFDLHAFDHLAIWNAECGRMEMHLVSRTDQLVNAARHTFAFKKGERLHTENSHKFSVESFTQLANEAGWRVHRHWLSAAPQFAVFSLKPTPHFDHTDKEHHHS
jgi:dimethylhistidine N-methyltransferase